MIDDEYLPNVFKFWMDIRLKENEPQQPKKEWK